MTNATHAIRNLVFEGGGVKGSVYAGAIEVLDQQGLYAGVRQVAGTSAGSITACMLACGAGSTGLTESVHHTDFRAFIADRGGFIGDAARMATHYGLHTGEGFVSILKQYIQRFAGDENINFRTLESLATSQPERYKSLTIIASNLTRQCSEVFNAGNHPNLPIWQAVRASISIPLVFEPMHIGDEVFVDGGLAENYPIDLFDEHCHADGKVSITSRNPETLGFYLEPHTLVHDGERYNSGNVSIDSLKHYGLALTSFLNTAANSRYIHPDDKHRTVFIDDLGVSSTDFSAPKAVIEALIASGRKATREWLDAAGNSHAPTSSAAAPTLAAEA